jgi:hypothetical protein
MLDALAVAARRYAEAGRLVFPCAVWGKRPNGLLVPHGLHDASRDVRVVREWWSRVPESNIGWPTQANPEDPFALDLDTKHGVDAWSTIRKLNEKHLSEPIPLDGPRTWTPSTPAAGLERGAHLWLRAEDLLPVPSLVGIAPGIDTRGVGGYVVVDPSNIDGRAYEGEPPLTNESVPFAPPWLLDLITKPRAAAVQPTAPSVLHPPPRNAEEIADRLVPLAATFWQPGRRRLLTAALTVFVSRDLGLDEARISGILEAVAHSARDADPIARDVIRDSVRAVDAVRRGNPRAASVGYWLEAAGVPELGVGLRELLSGGPARIRVAIDEDLALWAKRTARRDGA